MPISTAGVDDDFSNFIDDQIAQVEKQILNILDKIGRYAYDLAINHGNYQNRTGTLRSSIGYGVVKYGQLVKVGGFKHFKSSTKGPSIGKDKLNEKVQDCGADEISLVLVAGADYAEYVERMGYDVLSYSELKCQAKADELIEELFR